MKVLIDGKEVTCNNDVKIIYDDETLGFDKDLGGKIIAGQLHVTLTHEGMIADTFTLNAGNMSLEPYKTMWWTANDIIEETH